MKASRPCLLALALLISSAVAHGEEPSAKAEASKYFHHGLAFVRDGDLQAAVEAFEKAYAASPNYGVLYNLGQAYLALGRRVEAVHTFERFLDEGDTQIEASRRLDVEKLIGRERSHLCRLELDVSPSSAEVFVDGHRLGQSPFEVQELEAGEHVVVARIPGSEPRMQTLELVAGASGNVTLHLLQPSENTASAGTPSAANGPPLSFYGESQPSPPARVPSVVPRPPDRKHRQNIAIGVGVGGIVLATAAAVTFAWNTGRYETWRRDRDGFDTALANGTAGPRPQLQSGKLGSRAADIQHVDDLALGMALAAGGALITAAVLWLTASASHENAPSRRSAVLHRLR